MYSKKEEAFRKNLTPLSIPKDTPVNNEPCKFRSQYQSPLPKAILNSYKLPEQDIVVPEHNDNDDEYCCEFSEQVSPRKNSINKPRQ